MARITTKITYDRDFDEYTVTLRVDGKVDGTYYTNDKHDAKDTAADMKKRREQQEQNHPRCSHHGFIYVDLANDAGEVVKIGPGGYEIINNPPVMFIRGAGMLPLPTPVDGGSIEELREIANLDDEENFVLVVAWLLGSLNPKRPVPILLFNGEQGSGKSFTCRMVRRIIDPNASDLRSLPRDERELAISAKQVLVLAFDNVSFIKPSMSDSMCRIATGGGVVFRKLYTDDQVKQFEQIRPILVNGIGDVAVRPDFLDRSLRINLPAFNPLPRPNTLLIDSEQLEAGDALDDNFRSMAADEIERFRREIIERTKDARFQCTRDDRDGWDGEIPIHSE